MSPVLTVHKCTPDHAAKAAKVIERSVYLTPCGVMVLTVEMAQNRLLKAEHHAPKLKRI